ncbi:MAG: adenosylmethionine decarboxylase [Gemmatimonas sp.]
MPRKLSARNSGVVVELGQVAKGVALAADRDTTSNGKDYFVEKNGLKFAGTHLIVDLWGAGGLDDGDAVEQMLRDVTETCGATLLYLHVHRFSENGGISGVAVLAESHISIHTWPERGYAAVDIFMCGSAEPHKAIAVLRACFRPSHVQIAEHKRGMVE